MGLPRFLHPDVIGPIVSIRGDGQILVVSRTTPEATQRSPLRIAALSRKSEAEMRKTLYMAVLSSASELGLVTLKIIVAKSAQCWYKI